MPVGSPLPLGLWAGGTMFIREMHAPARSREFVFGRHAHAGAQEVVAGVHLLAPPCRLHSTRAVPSFSSPADVRLTQPSRPLLRQIFKDSAKITLCARRRGSSAMHPKHRVVRVLDDEHAISCYCYPLESINCSHARMVTGHNLPTLVQRYLANPSSLLIAPNTARRQVGVTCKRALAPSNMKFSPVQNAFGGSAISTMIYFAQQLVGVLLALER